MLTFCPCLLASIPAFSGGESFDSENRMMKVCFCCSPENDLYRVWLASSGQGPRYETPADAVAAASRGSGVLVLADRYPNETTQVDLSVFERAAEKDLRLYVEYPTQLPGMDVASPRTTQWERVVVTSEAFGSSLPRLSILMVNDCHFLPVQAEAAHLMLARVAGFDRAVYGLEGTEAHPILFEHPQGNLLVATTKLSHFITGRYAPMDGWDSIWNMILAWLQPGVPIPDLVWRPVVRPTLTQNAPLPADATSVAIRRGIDWYSRGRLLVHPEWKTIQNLETDLNRPLGDGSLGMAECFLSKVGVDGTQPICLSVRNDCNSESAMAFALCGKLTREERYETVARNLLDFVFFHSNLRKGPRSDPNSSSYGLVGWTTQDPYTDVYYGDDNARSLLGAMAASAALGTDRWDEPMLRCILANFRTAGPLGYRNNSLREKDFEERDWKWYWNEERTNFAPHFESWIWACYLWLYDKTGFAPLLKRTRKGIELMMEAYPDEWRWTNGIQQERARLLLPLAWLVRVEDTPRHRGWICRIAKDLLASQDSCGAIREELGKPGMGQYGPPRSNEEYGTAEATLIHSNGDPVADLLYTTNFAFLSLHEAASVLEDSDLTRSVDRLADFLLRIQVRSDLHLELDGAWFRGFDFRRWDYWASNADLGWGVWSTETGWTQGWILAVLTLRERKTNLWDLTGGSRIGDRMETVLAEMLPAEAVSLQDDET